MAAQLVSEVKETAARELSVALKPPRPVQGPSGDRALSEFGAMGLRGNPNPALFLTRWRADSERPRQEPSEFEPVPRVVGQFGLAYPANRELAKSTSERRSTPRYGLRVSLVFCPINSRVENGHHAKSINLSSRGVYFVTSHPVFLGLPVQVCLLMSGRVAGAPLERVFDGRVSHIEWNNVPSGSSGVGVEFFYRETPRETCR
jgi:hypothetical protein